MDIRIRRGRRTDFEALASLAGWPQVEQSLRRSIRLFRNVLSDLAYDLYVAEEGGSPVGLAAVSYTRVLALGGQRAMLEELIVRSDRRGAGIGRRLAEFVIARAARRGARAFEAWPSSETAEQFLDRLGFLRSGARYHKALPGASP